MKGHEVSRGGWIPEAEYEAIAQWISILSVDLLPVSADGRHVGLMLRRTYWDRQGWCLVGGSVQRGERVADAVARVVHWALGDDVSVRRGTLRFVEAVEYLPEPGAGGFFDPRKHAVALTYTGTLSGVPRPRGKAIGFRWFPLDGLPDDDEIGFDQARLLSPRLVPR